MNGDEAVPMPAEAQRTAEPAAEHVEVRFADRTCPRCQTRFVASYYEDDRYVKSRCLECQLFWPVPLMA
jgi:ribosomal protein S27AE